MMDSMFSEYPSLFIDFKQNKTLTSYQFFFTYVLQLRVTCIVITKPAIIRYIIITISPHVSTVILRFFRVKVPVCVTCALVGHFTGKNTVPEPDTRLAMSTDPPSIRPCYYNIENHRLCTGLELYSEIVDVGAAY